MTGTLGTSRIVMIPAKTKIGEIMMFLLDRRRFRPSSWDRRAFLGRWREKTSRAYNAVPVKTKDKYKCIR